MPISFFYGKENAEFPAFYFESVNLFCTAEDNGSITAIGKIDTGADLSVIPIEALETLGLQPSRDVNAIDFENKKHETIQAFWVRFEIEGLISKNIEVIALERPNVLVGRNVLNDLKLLASPKEGILSLDNP